MNNPQDATLRNIRALKKKLEALLQKLKRFTKRRS
jgi:hypothetical protein